MGGLRDVVVSGRIGIPLSKKDFGGWYGKYWEMGNGKWTGALYLKHYLGHSILDG